MPNPYDTAMGAPMDAVKMQAAADLLRRQEAFAAIGQLSGDPVLGRFGSGVMERTTGKRKSLRKAMESARKRQDCKPSGMPGQMICGGELKEVPGYYGRVAAEKEKDRQAAFARAQVSGGNALSNWLARKQYAEQIVPEATWRGEKGIATGISQIQNLKDVWEKTRSTPGVAAPGLDIAQETLGAIGLGSLGRWGEERFDLRSEPARGLRAQAAISLDRIRNSIFGSALTAYEISEGAKSNPLAAGISQTEMQNRMAKLMQYLATSARTQMAGRRPPGPPGSWQAPEWMNPGYEWMPAGGAEAAPQVTPGQMPQVPETGAGRTITPDQIPSGGAAPQIQPPQIPEGWTPEQWKLFQEMGL